ncbi:MAG: hypothetical protein HS101_05145 [Planctomycetia bacterium]|nr:hypothetical protein [Planctomycetia bacterium]MCC7314512.1 hypothetical protein [Planctomycetota bacterium]
MQLILTWSVILYPPLVQRAVDAHLRAAGEASETDYCCCVSVEPDSGCCVFICVGAACDGMLACAPTPVAPTGPNPHSHLQVAGANEKRPQAEPTPVVRLIAHLVESERPCFNRAASTPIRASGLSIQSILCVWLN